MTTFQEILASGERLPLTRALALVQGAALAVDALHARQNVHGAISPSSFQIDGNDRITLQSPDEASSAGDGADQARAYWSPQRQAGEPAHRVDDLYALGLIAEALFAGRQPSDDRSSTPTLPEQTIHPEIEAVLRAQRSWAPSQRFASGAELARELHRAVARATTPAAEAMTFSPPGGSGSGESFSPLPRTGPWGDGLPRGPMVGWQGLGEGDLAGDSGPLPDHEPAWAAARRVAQARAAHRLALAELPDRGVQERAQTIRTTYQPIQHREYPDFPLPGGWVVVLVVVLCSVYLFPLYFMLFPHG